jgi:hypothetical protein
MSVEKKNLNPMGKNWSVEKISKTYFKKNKITCEFAYKLKPEDRKFRFVELKNIICQKTATN